MPYRELARAFAPFLLLTSVSEPLDVQLLKRTEDEPQEYNAIDMQLASPGPR